MYKLMPLEKNVEEMFIGPFGSSLKSDCFVDKKDGYCMVYEQKHAIQKSMNVETRYISETKYRELQRFNVQGGDIIVSCRGTIGETYIVPDDAPLGIMHPSIMKIRLKEGVYDRHFFNLLLISRLKLHESEANGSGVKMAISASELGKELFPVPSLHEQQNIADIISKTLKLIKSRQSQLDALDNLVKARFVEMFGDPVLNPQRWRKVPLEENATLLNGRAYKQEELLDTGKYPVLRVGNFFSNRGWYYSDLELEDDKYCDNGDLLYAWSASFGPQIWNGGKVIYHYHIWKVLVGEAYNKMFLCKLLEYVTSSLMGDTHGIAMMHLTKSGMEKTEFIVPPLAKQEEFCEFVSQVDKSKVIIQQQLDHLETLRQSLMQEYFG